MALTLAAWFFWRTSRSASWAPLLLGLQFVFYLIGLLEQDLTLVQNLGLLSRDLLVLAGAGLLWQWLSNKKRLFWPVTIAILIALFFFYRNDPQKPGQQISGEIRLDPQGELLVELEEGVSAKALTSLVETYGLTVRRAFFPEKADFTQLDNYYLVDIPDSRFDQLATVSRALKRNPGVSWVEGNELVQVDPMPGAPARTQKGNYLVNDPGLEQLWGFEAMDVQALHQRIRTEKLKARKKALVAILDTGVDAGHEDLKANFKSLKTKHDKDGRGHGTHCAGIAAAVSNNGLGIASFAPDNGLVQVTSIKVLNNMGMGTQQSIIAGMLEAADAGVDVISMSLGGRSNQSKQRAYAKAVKYANKAGAIVVVAAGNANRNAKDYAPAGVPGVICVSALDEYLQKAEFSNYVSDLRMGIAAPGVNIYSTIPGNKYATYNGTSMATPYVSGLVGLLKSQQPDLNTREVYQILNRTGQETKNTELTGKLIRPEAALDAVLKTQ